MNEVSMLEFRHNAERIIARVGRGERMILTYRGKPVVRLEPICDEPGQPTDPFYALDTLADAKGQSLTNRRMDDIIYGS